MILDVFRWLLAEIESYLPSIITGAVAGVLAGSIVILYQSFRRRKRLKQALVRDIKGLLEDMHEVRVDLLDTIQTDLVSRSIRKRRFYTRTGYELYHAVQSDLLSYFPNHFERIAEFYNALIEIDSKAEAFYAEVNRLFDDPQLMESSCTEVMRFGARIDLMLNELPDPAVIVCYNRSARNDFSKILCDKYSYVFKDTEIMENLRQIGSVQVVDPDLDSE